MARKKIPQPDSISNKKTPSSLAITPTRKLEILGISIITVGVLIGISILSYVETDYTHLLKIDFASVFSGNDGAALRIKNWLGPIGAWISHFFVYYGFGYASIVIAGVILTYGWFVFRSKLLSNLNFGTLYSLVVMIQFSIVAGWFIKVYEIPSITWSGVVGETIAAILLIALSKVGSGLILFVLTIIVLLFGIDRDIQVTIDRIKEKTQDLITWFEEYQEKRKQAAALKATTKEKEQEKGAIPIEAKAEKAKPLSYGTPISKIVTEKPEPTRESDSNVDSESSAIEYDTERILEESRQRDNERLAKAKAQSSDLIGNRAVLERPKPLAEPKPEDEPDYDELDELDNSDGPAVQVFVGEGEVEAKKSDMKKMQEASLDAAPLIKYTFPTIDLLDTPPNEGMEVDMGEINENKRIILDKLKRHGIEIIAIDAIVGPTVTLYELTPAPDVKISKIESYANDLKMAMAAMGIRIIAPIPGKSAVGIEVPNQTRETVFIKQVINTKKFVESKMNLPIAFGKTIENEVFMVDLSKCPHLLVAGATGSGKSVGINTIITCLLYKCHPDNLKFVLVDPKKIELALYKSLERHFLATLPNMEEPIITDTSKVLEVLNSVCKEMDDRYDLLKLAGVRDLIAYNDKVKRGAISQDDGHRHLPYIVVIIDELADLMMTAGKQIEEPIARIAQLARAVGIHLVVATQRPSVNVITGTIKANFPARIAYQVASKIDSRTILDTMGADQLVGRGDMLYSGGGPMIRVQNAFVSTEEVERINAFIGTQSGYTTPYFLPMIESEEDQDVPSFDKSERDALFDEAAKVVVLHQQGSVSLLQRKLRLGYNRAGRLIDQLYAAGIVGPYQGSTAREVLVETEDELDEILRQLE